MTFRGDLDVRELPDGRWTLLADLCFDSPTLGRVCVPAGFITDFASVPRLPFVFWFYGDRARKAAVIHDYLYQSATVPRSVADQVFSEAMAALGMAPWTRGPMWAAVRLFGWRAYRAERADAMNPGLSERVESEAP